MPQNEGSESPYRIVLLLVAVATSLFIAGLTVNTIVGDYGVTVLDLAVTGVLSAALVILYYRQTQILNSQRELLTQELNREARQQHTETLRERVRAWHGNPDRVETHDPTEMPTRKTPTVRAASFGSATDHTASFMEFHDDTFSAVPEELQNDRYLQDLLANHAPELRNLTNRIERLQSEFETHRENFRERYQGPESETSEFNLEPADYLSRWVFEFHVRRYRDDLEDISAARERALSEIERGSAGTHPDEPLIWVRSDKGGTERAIYAAHWKSASREDAHELQPQAKEDVEQLVPDILTELGDAELETSVREAATLLEEGQDAIAELEQVLIEYEGRPIYTGECEYLEEASL